MRTTYAAQQLRDQVLQSKPRAKVENHGGPDGLGVVRSIVVSKSAASWLEEILDILQDNRIESYEKDEDGRLVVTFTTNARLADLRTPFEIEGVDAILRGK